VRLFRLALRAHRRIKGFQTASQGEDFSGRGNHFLGKAEEKISRAEEKIGKAEEKIGKTEEKIGRAEDFSGKGKENFSQFFLFSMLKFSPFKRDFEGGHMGRPYGG